MAREEPQAVRVVCALLLLAAFCASAAAQTVLKVKMLPGAHALPVLAAIQEGFFERRGVKVEALFAASAEELRNGLVAGEFDIAHAPVDDAVVMAELGGHKVEIVAGGDSSMNELFVQPDVATLKDLKGQMVLVDAPHDAYAIQLKKILRMNGLKEGDYRIHAVGGSALRLKSLIEDKRFKAAMLEPPFSVEAKAAGLMSLGRAVDLIGPYQGNGSFVMRSWLRGKRPILDRYLTGLIEGTRWALAPQNMDKAVEMLSAHVKLSPEIAARTWKLLADPKYGLSVDARFDMDGFRNVLILRGEIENTWGGRTPLPGDYANMGYVDQAVGNLAPPSTPNPRRRPFIPHEFF